MYNLVVICGKSASGKDSLLKAIVAKDPDFYSIVSYTTRPKRYNEIEGEDYYFITEQEMVDKIINGDMLEASIHNWVYGTTKNSFVEDKINIGVYNLEGINSIKDFPYINMIIFYIDVPDRIRLIRSLQRENNPNIEEIFRRYGTDKQDFEDLFNITENKHITLSNEQISDFENNVNFIIDISKKYFQKN